jgi:hypothetical protein
MCEQERLGAAISDRHSVNTASMNHTRARNGAFALIVALAIVFFLWANALTRREHAKFTCRNVEAALEEFVPPDSANHDTWDLFLAWPIDDPYLESIRQRCLGLTESRAAEDQVHAILADLRQHT